MGNIKGVVIEKGTVGANASGPYTATSAIIFNGDVTGTTLAANNRVRITSLKQAEALGFTPLWDTTADFAMHRHISEFYRMSGDGTPLWLAHTIQATPSAVFVDADNDAARRLITVAKGEIRQIALAWKADAFAVSTITIDDIGDDEDTIEVVVDGNVLGSYEKGADDTTPAAVAASFAAAISGYGSRAIASNGVITLKMPGGSLNATTPTINKTGTIAATATAFAGGKSETVTDGFNTEIRAAIASVQEFAEWAYSVDKPCHVVLEGRAFTATPSAAINLRSLTAGAADLDATKVSIVIGQDWNYAETRRLAAPFGIIHKLADVGTYLGTLAAAEMNQSTAEVAVFDLSDAKKAKWLAGALSNHVIIEDQDDELQQLDDYGYIFPISLTGVSGYRWNNDHVCARIIIDEDGNYNEHMIYYGRTLDECSRALKIKMLERLKSRVSVDSSTGKLSKGVIKNLEGEGNEVFNLFAGKGWLEDGATIVDPESDLITPPKSLLVSFKVVATPILDNISAKINLVKSIQL